MAMYTSRDDAQRKQINAFMTTFQEHPQGQETFRRCLQLLGDAGELLGAAGELLSASEEFPGAV